MIIPSKFCGYGEGGRLTSTRRVYDTGGGGSSAPAQQTVTKDLPEWARPTAERGLARAEALSEAPYQAYTGERIAGFDPLQQRAYQGAAGMQTSPELGTAANITQQAAMAGLGAGYQPGYFGNQFRAPGAYQTGQFDYLGAQAPDLQQYQMGPAERVAGGQYDAPMMDTARTGYRPDIQAFEMGPAERVAGGQYDAPMMDTARTGYRPDIQAFEMGPAERVTAGQYAAPEMTAAQTGYRPDLQQFQMGPAQQVGTQDYTGGNVAKYMDPYMQQVVDVQQREAQRQSAIAGTQEAGQAVKMGAFGGSRAGLLEAERQRNLATQLGNIQATGSQAAFQNAQQQFNQQQQRELAAQQANQQAGLTAGGQNLAAQLGVQQLGTQTGLQAALANLNNQQQAEVQNQAARLQTQGLSAGQAMQAALANQQAGLTVGQQNLASRQQAQQLGTQTGLQTALANLSAEQQANVQNQAAQLQTQGLTAGQAMQAALANQQAGLTVGQQNLASRQQAQQLGTQTGLQTALANLSAEQQANVQNQAARLQTQGLTAGQAMQAALANQQAGLTVGQQNLAAQLGIQQLGAGQNMQAQLANQQAYQDMLRQREASRQFGYGQQMTAAQQRAQYGQAAQQLAEQSRQFGAGYGLQGLQTALSGAGQLGNLGQQQFGQQKDILGLQQQFGAQQQALEQQRLAQQYQDFINQRRYPYQQLEFLTNTLQGTPMGTVQSMYQAPPTGMQTLGALGLGAYGLNQLMRKEGGTVSSYARGGSVTDDRFVAGALDRLSNAQLDQAEQVAKAEGDANRLRLIAEERATRASESRGLAGMYNSLPQDVQARMAGGGIVAFSGGGESSAADTINAAMDEAESSEGSAADVINAAMASPGAPDRYGRSLDTLDALIAQMSEAKPEKLSQEQLDDIIAKRFALEQRLAGPAPYGDIQKFIGEAEADRPKALQQAKGLAALKAMSAIVQPGGFIRGLAGAGGAAGDVMDKAFQADRAEKRSLASMKFNMADAQRKERMGMTKSAMDAARQAQRDKLDAHKSHMQSLSLRAQAAARGAQAAKPTGQKGASEPKAVEQYGLALAEYKRNPTPENKIKMESWLSAVQESRDIGPDRLAAIMAGVTGQRTAAELRADVAREGQERLVADKVLEARTRAQYSPAYLAAKTDAARAEVLRKAEADARAVYGSPAARSTTARPNTRPPEVIKLD